MIKLVTEHHESGATYRLIDSEGLPIAAVTDFLAYIALRGLSRKTARAYAFDLLCLYRWLPAVGRDAQTLEARDLLSFVASQQQRGAGPATINRQLITIRLFLRFVTGKDMGESAILRPTRGYYKGRGKDRYLGLHQLKRQRPLLRVKTPRKLIEPLTADEVRHFLKRLRRYRDLAIGYLLLLTGLRSCEILALKRGDVACDERRILVRGKGQKERMLPLPDVAIDILKRYLLLERPQSTQEKLFLVLQGKRRGLPMTEAGLRSIFRHRRRTTALRRANAHRFRHTFGADMARAGVRLPILQQMMGHQSPETTLRYINLSIVDVAAAYASAMKNIEKHYDSDLMRTF